MMSKIRKDRAVKWTFNDNDGNPIEYVGILKGTSKTHYTLDIPGLGEMEVDRTDGEFNPAPMDEYKAALNEDADQPEPEVIDTPIEETVNEPVETPKQTVKRTAKRMKSKSTKTFSVAGITNLNGKYKLRFTNDARWYLKTLMKDGHNEIRLAEVPTGTKMELAVELSIHPDFQDDLAQGLIADFIEANM